MRTKYVLIERGEGFKNTYTKLRTLHNSERFQNSGYAFFFYNEVRRLLGHPIKGELSRMSGLMPSNVQE